VTFVLIVAVLAALYGLVRGGSLDSLAATHFRFLWLLFAGLLVQLVFDLWVPHWLSETQGLLVLLGTNVVVAGFLALNSQLPGMLIAAAGLVLNVLVISVNGAMPVSIDAAEVAGFTGPLPAWGIKHEALTDATVLPWMADVIPIPGLRKLLSVGDLVLAAGIGRLVYKRTTEDDAGKEVDRVTSQAPSG